MFVSVSSYSLTVEQVPKLPMGVNKRKLPDNPTPDMLKKLKMDTESSSSGNVSAPSTQDTGSDHVRSRRTTVKDEDSEDDDMQHEVAPGGDADYFAEEDEEGRFFGGGLTSEQKEILNIFEKSEGQEMEGEVGALFPDKEPILRVFMYSTSYPSLNCVDLYKPSSVL